MSTKTDSLGVGLLLLFRAITHLLFWTVPAILGFLWENVYFGFGVGRAVAERVRDYRTEEAAS